MDTVILWCSDFSEVCMVCYWTGLKKSPSDVEVDLRDGDEGGIVMEVRHRARGILSRASRNLHGTIVINYFDSDMIYIQKETSNAN